MPASFRSCTTVRPFASPCSDVSGAQGWVRLAPCPPTTGFGNAAAKVINLQAIFDWVFDFFLLMSLRGVLPDFRVFLEVHYILK